MTDEGITEEKKSKPPRTHLAKQNQIKPPGPESGGGILLFFCLFPIWAWLFVSDRAAGGGFRCALLHDDRGAGPCG
jgi:hypothetical protein